MQELLDQASKVYHENWPNTTNFGKCFFLSWYCSVNDCNFCYRSTIAKPEDPSKSRRSLGSVFVEAFLSCKLGWDIEFITGGYGIYPLDDLVEITRVISKMYGHKVWLNLGVLNKIALERFKPYVEGVVASIETINPELRAKVCPSKPLEGYLQLYKNAGDDYKKSCAFIVGLGEKPEDIVALHNFIRDNKLDRITFYALKPVKGTPYKEGPESNYYASWIAKTRIAFPKLEIIAGITGRRAHDVGLLLKAGANQITKFPALRKFGSDEAKEFEKQLKESGREFRSNLTTLPDLDWNAEIDAVDISEEYKTEMKRVLPSYLKRLNKGKTKLTVLN
jgi:biotin synthase-like enzyme